MIKTLVICCMLWILQPSLPWLFAVNIGDEELTNFIGTMISHEIWIPINQPNSMECHRGLERCSDDFDGKHWAIPC